MALYWIRFRPLVYMEFAFDNYLYCDYDMIPVDLVWFHMPGDEVDSSTGCAGRKEFQ